MAQNLSAQLAATTQSQVKSTDELIALYHAREIRAFDACHDEEAHFWSDMVDQLRTSR